MELAFRSCRRLQPRWTLLLLELPPSEDGKAGADAFSSPVAAEAERILRERRGTKNVDVLSSVYEGEIMTLLLSCSVPHILIHTCIADTV